MLPDPDLDATRDPGGASFVMCPSTEAVLLADGRLLLVPGRDRPQLQVDAPWGRLVHEVVVQGHPVDARLDTADREVVAATIRHLAASDVLIPAARVAAADVERYDRQVRWLAQESGDGPRCQRRLAAATVLLLGVGGFGAATAELLARAGVGRLVLVDYDRIEEVNLSGQLLYDELDVGTRKSFAAAAHLERIAPEVESVPVDLRIASTRDVTRLVRRYRPAAVVCAADSPAGSIKQWTDEGAFEAGVPVLHAGCRIPYAHVGPLLVPGRTQCFGCYFRSNTAHGGDDLERAACAAREAHPSVLPSAAWCDTAAAAVASAQLIGLLTGAYDAALVGRRWELDLRTLDAGWHEPVAGRGAERCERCRVRDAA